MSEQSALQSKLGKVTNSHMGCNASNLIFFHIKLNESKSSQVYYSSKDVLVIMGSFAHQRFIEV
jgi:hypothetical protein